MEPAHLCLEFRVFLVNASSGRHAQVAFIFIMTMIIMMMTMMMMIMMMMLCFPGQRLKWSSCTGNIHHFNLLLTLITFTFYLNFCCNFHCQFSFLNFQLLLSFTLSTFILSFIVTFTLHFHFSKVKLLLPHLLFQIFTFTFHFHLFIYRRRDCSAFGSRKSSLLFKGRGTP